MPSRFARHQPPGFGAERRAAAARDRIRLALRPSPAERGYDADWLALRAAHLARQPMCVVHGCGQPATDVDHVEAVADAPHRRLDPTNLRSMCHAHHAARTARDQGFARHGDGEVLRGARHPTWLRRVGVPLTVVCGPPASGKSTFVQHRAGPRDLILDPNTIATTVARHGGNVADLALRWRNGRLALLDHVHRWPAAWLIVSEPRAHWRGWWVDHVGASSVTVLETEPGVCFDRIEGRPTDVRAPQRDGVVSWWSRYTRRNGDMVHRPDARPFVVNDGTSSR